MIEVNNLTKARISSQYIKKVLRQALNVLKKKMDISVAIVTPRKIKEINKKYRQVNQVTDVLSFEELNEIIICYQQARKQAILARRPIKEEIKLLLVHGLLHLLGYDHQTKKEEKRMRLLTDRIRGSISE